MIDVHDSAVLDRPVDVAAVPAASTTPLHRRATVAALVPHFHCETWLADCLASLVGQTRALAAIVVIDDGSGDPPIGITSRFPNVTLLAAAANVGPYHLIQRVIDRTPYDAYLFQDADDWSGRDRLAILLDEAERTGAELVGSQEVLIACGTAEVRTVAYPLDVNQFLCRHPGNFALVHHASLVSRDLVRRTGGFATGLRFGGDAEFLQRAVFRARIRNVPHHVYFRRERPGSLTTTTGTGMDSDARRTLARSLRERAAADARVAARGGWVSTEPWAVAEPVSLVHLHGPRVGSIPRGTS